MENEFEVLRDALQDKGITLNATAADERVPQNRETDKGGKGTSPRYMELITLQKIPKQNDHPHGGKRRFLAHRAPRENSGMS